MSFPRFFFTGRYPRGKYCGMKKQHWTQKYAPSDSDIEQVVDEARAAAGLGPTARTPEQGIKDMDARIRELTVDRKKILNRLAFQLKPSLRATLLETLAECNKAIKEARSRKTAYELELKSNN